MVRARVIELCGIVQADGTGVAVAGRHSDELNEAAPPFRAISLPSAFHGVRSTAGATVMSSRRTASARSRFTRRA